MRVTRFCRVAMMTTLAVAQPVFAQGVHRSHGFATEEPDLAQGNSARNTADSLVGSVLSVGLLSPTQSGTRSLRPNDAKFRLMIPGADTIVKRNRGLGAVIGGGIGLAIGGVIGYRRGDPHVAFDQVTGAAIYGGVGAVIGAIIGAVFAPSEGSESRGASIRKVRLLDVSNLRTLYWRNTRNRLRGGQGPPVEWQRNPDPTERLSIQRVRASSLSQGGAKASSLILATAAPSESSASPGVVVEA